LLGVLTGIIDQAVTDKDLAARIKADLQSQGLQLVASELDAQKDIIVAESKGGGLQGNWRPITMLTFVGLISAHWLGFTPENLPESQVLALLDIVKVGLGGYVVGRSAEKVATVWKK